MSEPHTTTLDALIAKNLREDYEKQKAAHKSSGKLSASQLNKPLLEQVLKIIGVPEAPIEDYTLRLFERGKQVEKWICSILPGEEQIEVDYKGCIGFIDKLIDGVPVEIKSVKSTQWKWLKSQGSKWGHDLQGGMYALGKQSDTYKIIYVNSNDFQVLEFVKETKGIAPEIDGIIKETKLQLIKGILPEFKAREDWQSKETYAKYSNYPDWISLTPETAMKKLERDFPQAFNKLATFKDKIKKG